MLPITAIPRYVLESEESYEERRKRALEEAAKILVKHKIDDDIKAYFILVKNQEKLRWPVDYEFVIEALAEARAYSKGI